MNQPLQLLTIIPAANESARQTLLTYIPMAPIAPDHWKVLKTIYKQYEATPNADITAAIITKLDQCPIRELTVTYPTQKTVAYMKRRARRFLKSITDETLYFQLASQILLAHEGKEEFHFDYQWITADIMLGNSRRLLQEGHGRGKVVCAGRQFHYHRVEERHPTVWDKQQDFIQSLFAKELPWPILEFAVKIAVRNGWQLPAFSALQLNQFFEVPSLWLNRIAAEQTYTAFQSGKVLSASEWAGLLIYGNAAVCNELRQSNWSKQNDTWKEEVATWLPAHLLALSKIPKPSRRITEALHFLYTHMKARIDASKVLDLAPILFRSGHKGLENWAFELAEKAPRDQAFDWFATTSVEHHLSRLVQAFAPKFKKAKLDTAAIKPYIFHPSFVVCQFGWELVKHNSRYFYQVMGEAWAQLVKGVGKPGVERPLFHTVQSNTAAELFIQYYTDYAYYLSDNTSFPWSAYAYVLMHGNDQYKKFLFQKLLQWFKEKPLLWLPLLSQCPEEARQEVLQRTMSALRAQRLFNTSEFMYAIRNMNNIENEWFWRTLLQLMDSSVLPQEDVKNVLECAAQDTKALIYLLKFTPVLTDARKKQWFLEKAGNLLANQPTLIAGLDEKLTASLLANATSLTLVEIATVASDENWQRIYGVIYQRVKNLPHSGLFWRDVLQKVVDAEAGEVLSVRLFGEPTLLTLFVEYSTPEILDVQHPAVEKLLDQWMQKNMHLLSKNTSLLYKACMHKLPSVRDRALAQVTAQGMEVSMLVRLLESDLPPAQQAVYQHLEKLEIGSAKEWDAILAMCDSPNQTTRQFGLAFLQQRKNQWPADKQAQLLEFLSEHADASMHNWVSQELLVQQVSQPFVERFDKEVLRIKNRSRQAKENIKQREEKSQSLPTSVLLEMARSKGKKDAEWAVWQLTQRSLAGEEIPGFNLK